MAIPKWHEMMQPVLSALGQGETLTSKDLTAVITEYFSLTEDDLAERLKSGQLRHMNRLHWAIVDLHKAGFVDYGNERGTYRITPDGQEFLSRHPEPFTANTLMAESEAFKEWKTGYRKAYKEKKASGGDATDVEESLDESSPLEAMQEAYSEVREALADELLQTIMQHTPWFFEYMVGKLLNAMGYGASLDESVHVTRKTADEGIDGIVKEDRLGFDSVYYQAKRWDLDRTVSRPDVQSFVGALSGKGATKGLFITTAKFSSGARDYAEGVSNQKIVLVDGKTLAELMIDYGVGVSTVNTFEIKQIDSDFFSEE